MQSGTSTSADRSISLGTAAAILILVALAVRLVFFIGYQGRDDRTYLGYAQFIAAGHPLSTVDVQTQWIGRIGFWWPVALSIEALGRNQFAYVLFPLLCSLGSVLLTLALGAHTIGRRPAILAAAFVAVVPIDVLYATKTYPDLPLGLFMVASFWLAIRARDTGSLALAVGAGLALGMGYLQKETAIFALLPIALSLRLWSPRHWRIAAAIGAALALVLAAELVLWSVVEGDPLYRVHSTQSVMDRESQRVAQVDEQSSWIPGPSPGNHFRSTNSLLDAVLCLGMNEEFGFLFWLLIPLLAWGAVRRDLPNRDLWLWVVTLTALILFFPIKEFPRYTLQRDPRYLTCVTIPAALIVAYHVHRMPRPIRAVVVAGFIATSLLCIYIGTQSARMEPQQTLLRQYGSAAEPLWVTPQLAADLLIMGGENPPASLGIHLLEQGRGADSFQAAMLVRPDIPVAETADELKSGVVIFRGRNEKRAPEGWRPFERIEPVASWPIRQIQRVLRTAGLPELAQRLAPGGGEVAVLYRPAPQP